MRRSNKDISPGADSQAEPMRDDDTDLDHLISKQLADDAVVSCCLAEINRLNEILGILRCNWKRIQLSQQASI